jgi:hypothetical protein
MEPDASRSPLLLNDETAAAETSLASFWGFCRYIVPTTPIGLGKASGVQSHCRFLSNADEFPRARLVIAFDAPAACYPRPTRRGEGPRLNRRPILEPSF